MLAVAGAIIWIGSAAAAPLPVTATANSGALLAAVAIERPPVEAADVDQSEPALNFRRQLVDYSRNVAAGTVVIDTDQTYLYFVLGDGKAIRYGIGVGREGFTWSGVEAVTRKAEWPDWIPSAEMIARQPYLTRFTAGGEGNPLGARVDVGTKVVVLPNHNSAATIAASAVPAGIAAPRTYNTRLSNIY